MADGSAGVSPEGVGVGVGVKAGGEIWGTLEELLLACAVSRHGTASWDSVAAEVQTRSPPAARPGLTPLSCRLRFRHLHRRFSAADAGAGAGEDPDASAAEGWVDELRRLRVAELRRDVERCDLSIGTLQSKVKRLREERERSVSGEEKPEELSGNDRLSGEEPGRSCRESNSTDLKPPRHPGHPAAAGGGKEEEVAKREPSGESAAAASRESSDVRSSASLCRRRDGGKPGRADDEEAASAPPRPPPSQSPPATTTTSAALLDAVAARLGPVLDRLRHENQEGAVYRGTIRRHVDLDTVRARLDRAAGSGGSGAGDYGGGGGGGVYYPAHELYRDLLLLCTNVVVFFPRGAPENAAAAAARALVSGHVATAALREPKQERHAEAVPVAAPAGGDIVGSLIEKGKPLIVCRKRSSIAKAAAAAVRKEESAEKGETEEADEEDDDEESDQDAKKAVAARGLRTKKGRGGAVKRLVASRLVDGAAAADGAKKADKKGSGADADGPAKKRKAVDFLKRLNQGSTTSRRKRGSPLGTTRKRSTAVAVAEPQKTRRGGGRKETGRGGGSKRGSRAGGAKRGVGRPLKRGPALATPPPAKRAKTSRAEKPPASSKRGGRR